MQLGDLRVLLSIIIMENCCSFMWASDGQVMCNKAAVFTQNLHAWMDPLTYSIQ